jgi:hypothetical protein
MIAFEVTLNGQRLCTASAGETGVLTAAVTWVMRTAPGVTEPSDLRLEVGGLAKHAHLRWPAPRTLAVGDEVIVRILDAAHSDPPSRTERDDQALVEAEERKYYERLKLKYEPR